jgi:hypothetical protein
MVESCGCLVVALPVYEAACLTECANGLEVFAFRASGCKRPLAPLAMLGRSRYCSRCYGTLAKLDAAKQINLAEDCIEDLKVFAKNGLKEQDTQEVLARYRQDGLRDIQAVQMRVYADFAEEIIGSLDADESDFARMEQLRDSLGLTGNETCNVDRKINQAMLLSQVRAGKLPTAPYVPIPLRQGEVAHFSFTGTSFLQERVTGQRYEGGSAGLTIPLGDGFALQTGSQRGQFKTEVGLVEIDRGTLVLTSERLVFSGPQKAFGIELGEILRVDPARGAISVVRDSADESAKPFFFANDDPGMIGIAIMACIDAKRANREPSSPLLSE